MKKDQLQSRRVVAKLDQIGFLKVVDKKRRPLQGAELEAWIKPLRDQHYDNEELAERIFCQVNDDTALPPPPIDGQSGVVSPAEATFLYMDVGAWIGSFGTRWDEVKNGLNVKRDFGIVVGPLALLCTFSCVKGRGSGVLSPGELPKVVPIEPSADWQRADKSKEPFRTAKRILDCLERSSGDEHGPQLGKPVVRDMAFASGSFPLWPKPRDWRAHVIVGDMHIPVLDSKSQTYGQELEHTADGGVVIPERVARRGRVDLRVLEDVVKALIPDPKDPDGLRKVVAFLNKGIDEFHTSKAKFAGKVVAATALTTPVRSELLVALPSLGVLAVEEAWRRGDGDGIKNDTMNSDEAERWFEYYMVGREGPPADVFEGAGAHFHEFMKRLARYSALSAPDKLPLKFLQLGDMFDYWVGFTCHYEPAHNPDQPVSPDPRAVSRMLQYWTNNILSKTAQGREVAKALAIAENSGFDPTYLYGNHDNYLGASLSLTYDHDGEPTKLAPRQSNYVEDGLFVEHGHQWEGSNADDASRIWGVTGLTMGTSSPTGMFVTQAAFIRPYAVRNFEGVAAGMVANLSETYGQRLDQVRGAAHRYLESSGGFYCYVMGHTHEPALTRVHLRTKHPGTIDRFRKEMEQSALCRVYPLQGTDEIRDLEFVSHGFGLAPTVRVGFNDMLGAKENEWVGLEHPDAPPPGDFKLAIKGAAVQNDKGTRGIVDFHKVPPGVYQARYYLTRVATQPFKSSRGLLGVEGVSLEGDTQHAVTSRLTYHAAAKSFDRKTLFLRWAYDPSRFDASDVANAWIGLYRAGQAATAISPLTRDAKVPQASLVALGGSAHFYHGRWDILSGQGLSRPFVEALSHGGHFVFRVFANATHQHPLGEAALEVSRG
ncbi:MAG: hypothetical protein U0271_16970 [Polyangiaceae bacterium]